MIAKDLKAQQNLYGEVLKGTESSIDQERVTFHDVWFNKGVAEIKSILDTGVTLDELRWDSFKELASLYEPVYFLQMSVLNSSQLKRKQ